MNKRQVKGHLLLTPVYTLGVVAAGTALYFMPWMIAIIAGMLCICLMSAKGAEILKEERIKR